MMFSSGVALIFAVFTLTSAQYQQQQQQQQQQQFGQPPQQQQQFGQAPPQGGQVPVQGQNVLHDSNKIHDAHHMKDHMHGVLQEQDISKMSEEELQFHYFKLHDNDNNNKLDGTELIKSLLHWHVEESKNLGANAPASGTTKIFTDDELINMIDPILNVDDKNLDGFIDYSEFFAAQKNRGNM